MDRSSGPDEGVRITTGDWVADISTTGAALAQLTCAGRELLDGFAPPARSLAARGQILAPWTNRLRDGRYEFGDRVHDLEISEPETRTALHGLVAEVPWTVVSRSQDSVVLEHRLEGAVGYPWTLLLRVTYRLAPSGLVVTHDVSNLAPSEAPYAVGAHPYLVAGDGPVDDWVVELDASHVMVVDPERLLPLDVVDVAQVGLDLRQPRAVGSSRLDHAFTGLGHEADGRTVVTVSGERCRVVVWGGVGCRWIQLYTGDHDPVSPRRSIAVEPMSSPADAFNSGRDLVVLAPAGRPGSTHVLQWGVEVDLLG